MGEISLAIHCTTNLRRKLNTKIILPKIYLINLLTVCFSFLSGQSHRWLFPIAGDYTHVAWVILNYNSKDDVHD